MAFFCSDSAGHQLGKMELWGVEMVVKVMGVKDIKQAIVQLPVRDLDQLVHWLEDYRAQLWDKQIEEDLAAGRLEALVAEVNEEYEAGLSQPL
jgi:hypothetical protein